MQSAAVDPAQIASPSSVPDSVTSGRRGEAEALCSEHYNCRPQTHVANWEKSDLFSLNHKIERQKLQLSMK